MELISEDAEVDEAFPSSIPEISRESMTEFNREHTRLENVGEGVFGHVWKIRQSPLSHSDNPESALKVMEISRNKKNLFGQLKKEGDILELIQKLRTPSQHPGQKHVVRIDEVWSISALDQTNYPACRSWLSNYLDTEGWNLLERVLFIKMEYCNNKSLDQWLTDCETKNLLEDGKKFFVQVVDGLSYIQEIAPKIVHRDLKPKNILLHTEGNCTIAKIGDFGLSRQRMEDGESRMECPFAHVLFQAPEEVEQEVGGGKNYTNKYDIYLLGMILFFIFDPSYYTMDYLVRVQLVKNFRKPNTYIPEDSNLSRNFPVETQLVRQLLANDPGERPSAAEIRVRLDEIWGAHQVNQFSGPQNDAKISKNFEDKCEPGCSKKLDQLSTSWVMVPSHDLELLEELRLLASRQAPKIIFGKTKPCAVL